MWEIVDAIGSLLSAVLAGVAGFVAFRLYGIESARDKEAVRLQQRRDADARQQQAAAVGFWDEWGGGQAGGGQHGAPAPVTYVLTVSNHSNLPIYEVTIYVHIPKTHANAEMDVRAQLDEWARQIHHFVPVLKPGTPVTVTILNPPSANPGLGLFQGLVAGVTLTSSTTLAFCGTEISQAGSLRSSSVWIFYECRITCTTEVISAVHLSPGLLASKCSRCHFPQPPRPTRVTIESGGSVRRTAPVRAGVAERRIRLAAGSPGPLGGWHYLPVGTDAHQTLTDAIRDLVTFLWQHRTGLEDPAPEVKAGITDRLRQVNDCSTTAARTNGYLHPVDFDDPPDPDLETWGRRLNHRTLRSLGIADLIADLPEPAIPDQVVSDLAGYLAGPPVPGERMYVIDADIPMTEQHEIAGWTLARIRSGDLDPLTPLPSAHRFAENPWDDALRNGGCVVLRQSDPELDGIDGVAGA